MILLVIVVVAIVVGAVRLFLRARRRRGATPHSPGRPRLAPWAGDTGIVAAREVRERVRGRVFRVGTLLILAVVAAAIVIPTLTRSTPQPQRVGVVGALPASLRSTVAAAAKSVGTSVRFVDEADGASARHQVQAGTLDLAIIDGRALLVNQPIDSKDTSTTAQFVAATAQALGVASASGGRPPHAVTVLGPGQCQTPPRAEPSSREAPGRRSTRRR